MLPEDTALLTEIRDSWHNAVRSASILPLASTKER
jgi:hypothetical protein